MLPSPVSDLFCALHIRIRGREYEVYANYTGCVLAWNADVATVRAPYRAKSLLSTFFSTFFFFFAVQCCVEDLVLVPVGVGATKSSTIPGFLMVDRVEVAFLPSACSHMFAFVFGSTGTIVHWRVCQRGWRLSCATKQGPGLCHRAIVSACIPT